VGGAVNRRNYRGSSPKMRAQNDSADECFRNFAVILRPFAVILSEAEDLALPLRVNYAKDLALRIFKARRDSSSVAAATSSE